MIPVSVRGLAFDPDKAQPIIVLNDDIGRSLPIWIGIQEARAIAFALEKRKSPRPLPHDLMLNIIDSLGYKLEQVEIDVFDGSTYRATMKLAVPSNGCSPRSLDARPSDAIAIAISAGAPIFAAPDVMVNALIVDQPTKAQDEFKAFVDTVKASDFKLPSGQTVVLPPDDYDGDRDLDFRPESESAPAEEKSKTKRKKKKNKGDATADSNSDENSDK